MGTTAFVLLGVSIVAIILFEKLNAAFVLGAAAITLGLVGLTVSGLERKMAEYEARATRVAPADAAKNL